MNLPDRAALMKEIETVTEPLLDEVMVFVRFIKGKSVREGLYTAIASESAYRSVQGGFPEEREY
jgi:hypothetical protein